jgi:hypothetical protein
MAVAWLSRHYDIPVGRKKRSRLALLTTVTDDIAMAAPAAMGMPRVSVEEGAE